MGINAELVALVKKLRQTNALLGESVVELGSQNVCVASEITASILNLPPTQALAAPIKTADQLYAALGFSKYASIDANGENSSLVFDLNEVISDKEEGLQIFDLVTNLGTAEHCFNQYAVFKNIHNLCKNGGVMIHALPSQGSVNHAFYNYHPRFFAEISAANHYDILDLFFTVDYNSKIIPYSISNFKEWDSHDILLYAALRKTSSDDFRMPFDGMFAAASKLDGYKAADGDPLTTQFSPYLKGGDWNNTKGYAAKPNNTKLTLADLFRSIFVRVR